MRTFGKDLAALHGLQFHQPVARREVLCAHQVPEDREVEKISELSEQRAAFGRTGRDGPLLRGNDHVPAERTDRVGAGCFVIGHGPSPADRRGVEPRQDFPRLVAAGVLVFRHTSVLRAAELCMKKEAQMMASRMTKKKFSPTNVRPARTRKTLDTLRAGTSKTLRIP